MKKSENDKKAKKERGDVDTIISLFCALVIFIRVCIRFLQAGYVYGVEIRNKNDKKTPILSHNLCRNHSGSVKNKDVQIWSLFTDVLRTIFTY